MKSKDPNAREIFQSDLTNFVRETTERGATPILITSMERKAGAKSPTLVGYPDLTREVAAKTGDPLIDLNTMSVALYQAMGSDLGALFQDGSHHNIYGSYLLANCVATGAARSAPGLAKSLVSDFEAIDPEDPRPRPDEFAVPASTMKVEEKPLGA